MEGASQITLPIKIFFAHPHDDEDTLKVKKILYKMSPPLEISVFPSTKYQLYFPMAIRKSIEEADVLIAILNKAGRENQFVNQEVGIAVANDIDIVIMAEDKEALRGFVNQRNKDILPIESDDLEEDLRNWIKEYQEKNKLKILEKLIVDDLKDLKRIIDVQIFEKEETKKPKGAKAILKHLESLVDNAIAMYENKDYLPLSHLASIRGIGVELSNRPYTKFKSYGNNTKLYDNIEKYFNARGHDEKIEWYKYIPPKTQFEEW